MSSNFHRRRGDDADRDMAELLMHLNRIKDPELRAALIEFIIDTGKSFNDAAGNDDDAEDEHRLN